MRLLDLFCKAGGAAKGYADAGWEVVGIDIEGQPHYPYPFYRGDVFDLGITLIEQGGWDAIHASPPCQAYSRATIGNGIDYPDEMEPTRALLRASGLPYIIENVELAPLEHPTMLCGTTFGLGVEFEDQGFLQLRRHRYFESNVPLHNNGPCRHIGKTVSVFGKPGGYDKRRKRQMPGVTEWKKAMGIDWMTGLEITQAVPPKMTKFLGEQLLRHIERTRAA